VAIGVSMVQKKFNVTVFTNSDMTIKRCYSSVEAAIDSAYKNVCEDMGGVLNTVDGKCQFFSLYRGQHTGKQCTAMGGTVEGIAPDMFCRISSNLETPRSWTPMLNWTTTVATAAKESDCTGESDKVLTASNFDKIMKNSANYQSTNMKLMLGCTTGSHAWSDTKPEECTFTCGDPSCTLCDTQSNTLEAKIIEQGFY
jgi:hypothetical protein